VAGLHEGVFESAGVDQQHVGVGVLPELEGRPGTDRDDVDGVAGVRGEEGQ
jgi:hypothetical protein